MPKVRKTTVGDVEIITPGWDDDQLTADLRALTRDLCAMDPSLGGVIGLGGEDGYGANFENEVFVMRRYYWGDCDCGADERSEVWHAAHPHGADCFREELHRRFAEYDESSGYNAAEAARLDPDCVVETVEQLDFGVITRRDMTPKGEAAHRLWSNAHDARNKAHSEMTRDLYRERGLPPSPYQWLCTCGVDDLAKAYFATEGHYPTCALELPNFRHKQSGVEVRWYKWIGRDNEIKAPNGADVLLAVSEAIASLKVAQ